MQGAKPQPDIQPRLLAKPSVAAYLGVSPRTIDNYRAKPGFPQPVPGLGDRITRWDRADLDAWIDSRKAG